MRQGAPGSPLKNKNFKPSTMPPDFRLVVFCLSRQAPQSAPQNRIAIEKENENHA